MVVARRILRRRAAAKTEYQGSAAAELAGEATISRTHARPRVGARFFILLWTAIIFLPEDLQVRAATGVAAAPISSPSSAVVCPSGV